MIKDIYVNQITELLEQCNDLSVLDLIVKLLNETV